MNVCTKSVRDIMPGTVARGQIYCLLDPRRTSLWSVLGCYSRIPEAATSMKERVCLVHGSGGGSPEHGAGFCEGAPALNMVEASRGKAASVPLFFFSLKLLP